MIEKVVELVRRFQLMSPRSRDRILTFEEIAAILEKCVGRPEREHLVRFIVVELGTAGRPDAVLELTDKNIDLKRGLIDPNHEGRVHTRKRRAIVPIARHVLPWVSGAKGKLIKYRVPIAKKNRVPGGPSSSSARPGVSRRSGTLCATTSA